MCIVRLGRSWNLTTVKELIATGILDVVVLKTTPGKIKTSVKLSIASDANAGGVDDVAKWMVFIYIRIKLNIDTSTTRSSTLYFILNCGSNDACERCL